MASAIALAALAACNRNAAPPVTDEAVAEKARAALAPFKKNLRDELQTALQRSPVEAIDVCAQRAPDLARAASHDGVLVGRSAHKLRNPDNAPRPWLGPVMDDLAKQPSGSAASRVVTLPDGRRGYAEAIWIAAPCLTCHGDNLAAPVADKLRERYPNDAARGFHAGDLRGVFWAEIEPAALRPKG